jgi:hypothetical protein
MVQAVDEDVLRVLQMLDLLTTLRYHLLRVIAVRLELMHELSSILDDKVSIVT